MFDNNYGVSYNFFDNIRLLHDSSFVLQQPKKIIGVIDVFKKIVVCVLVALLVLSVLPLQVMAVEIPKIFETNPFQTLDDMRMGAKELRSDKAQKLSMQNHSELDVKQKQMELLQKQEEGTRFIVQFKSTVLKTDIAHMLEPFEYRVLGNSDHRLFGVTAADEQTLKNALGDTYIFIEKDSEAKQQISTNDSKFSSQWALTATKTTDAWAITKGSSNVYVAIIDSGVTKEHEDLVNSDIRNGWDYIFDEFTGWDSTGHGTKTTGIIAATTNNSKGIAGVCWNVAIVPLRVVWHDGTAYVADICAAIYDAADLGCDVINISLGGYSYVSAQANAVAYALSKGSIVVAPAGNDGTSAYIYPASFPGVISVASVNSSLNSSLFSNYNDMVDVSAPGENIWTTSDWYYDDYDYTTVTGTSFSAPYVSGIAALMRNYRDNINAYQFDTILKYTSIDRGPAGYDYDYGYGVINAQKVLQYLQKSDNAYLSGISLSAGTLTPSFSGGTFNYDAILQPTMGSTTITVGKQDAGATVKINGSVRNSITVTVAEESSVPVTVEVTAANGFVKRTYVVTARRIPPLITAQDALGRTVTNQGYSNQNVTISANGSYVTGLYANLNGSSVSWPYNNTFSAEGNYVITGATVFGNNSVFNFTIDKTNPVISASTTGGIPVDDGMSVDNEAVVLFVSDVNLQGKTATVGGVSVTWPVNDTFMNEGVHVITATDKGGNSTQFGFEIDLPPTFSVKNEANEIVASGSMQKSTVTVTCVDTTLTLQKAYINDIFVPWPNNGVFTGEGIYLVCAQDDVGHQSSFSFTIDKTAPTVTLSTNSQTVLLSGSFTTSNVTASVFDTYLQSTTVKKNGESIAWPANNIFTEEGKYEITVLDTGGNKTVSIFTIDKTKPVIAVKNLAGTSIPNGGVCLGNAAVTVTEANRLSQECKRNGVAYSFPAGFVFTQEGTYDITVKDKVGNVTTARFIVDKTKPFISAKCGTVNVANGVHIGGSVTVTVQGNSIASMTYSKDYGAAVKMTGTVQTFSPDGRYQINVKLANGNSTSFVFVIDRAKPVITAKNAAGTAVATNAYVNTAGVTVAITDKNAVTQSVTRNGATMSWPSGNKFTLEGRYIITAKDKAGNTATYIFTIDRTAPIITVKNADGTVVANNGYSNSAQVTALVWDLSLNTRTVTRNGAAFAWPSQSIFTQEGKYVVTATDKVGLKKTYTFTIDR